MVLETSADRGRWRHQDDRTQLTQMSFFGFDRNCKKDGGSDAAQTMHSTTFSGRKKDRVQNQPADNEDICAPKTCLRNELTAG
jgi:hypothetical protein